MDDTIRRMVYFTFYCYDKMVLITTIETHHITPQRHFCYQTIYVKACKQYTLMTFAVYIFN